MVEEHGLLNIITEGYFSHNRRSVLHNFNELRNREESALKAVDNIISDFALRLNGKIFHNYRDYPSRTIYWKERRTVKYIQIRLNLRTDGSNHSEDIYRYEVFTSYYRIVFPILNFWNMRFDANTKHYNKIGELCSPINQENLSNLLHKAYSSL